ncbi:MAG: hypothetical protein IKP65_01345 [Alphaproteobacteria bacterium]|nr:hypothetical protein [Alphaproteobacteria bacterium]
MNLDICKKCMDNAIDIKIIDSIYYGGESGWQIILECYYKNGYSFQNYIWINSSETTDITKKIKTHGSIVNDLSEINVRSCSYAVENNFLCPYIIEHQISEWNKKK